ncbi:MAG: MFS transporter [Anaerolineae bacterium]|nr:MFS transporter [Anaerolineae bacterium]
MKRLLNEWGVTSSRESLLFMIYAVVFHIGIMGMNDVLLNFYFVSLGHSEETIGLLQSIPRLGGFVTSIPVGLIASRFGARRIIIVSTVGLALSFFTLVFFPSLPALGLSRFMLGFLYGAQQIALSPLMFALVEPEKHIRFFAAHNVLSMLGMAFGSLIGGFTPALMVALFGQAARVSDPHTAFAYGLSLLLAGITGVLSIWPLLHMTTDTVKQQRRAQVRQARIRWGRLFLLSLPLLTFGFTGGLTFPFYNLFFRIRFAQPDHAVGTILSLAWIGMALIPLLNPLWEQRFGRVWTLGITLSIAALSFFGLSLAGTLAISIVFYVLAASFRNVMQPIFQPLVMSHVPAEQHNIISSLNMILWNIGWFGATAISGFLQKEYGFALIMQIVALGVLFTAASVVLIFRQRTVDAAASEMVLKLEEPR